MDKRNAWWVDLAITGLGAWMMLTPDQQDRIIAGTLRTAGHLCRHGAEQLGRAAMRCETACQEVLRP